MLGSFSPEHVDGEEPKVITFVRIGIFLILCIFLLFLSCLFAPLSLMCNEWSQCPATGGNRDKEVREREERKY